MREDIVAGLKNALEREIPLEKAIQSFINAGYNPVEVKQAAESMTDGATATINHESEDAPLLPPVKRQSNNPFINAREMQARPQFQTTIPRAQIGGQSSGGVSIPTQSVQTYAPQSPMPKKLNEFKPMKYREYSRSNTPLIVILIIILLLLIGGLIYLIFFGQKLIDTILNSPI